MFHTACCNAYFIIQGSTYRKLRAWEMFKDWFSMWGSTFPAIFPACFQVKASNDQQGRFFRGTKERDSFSQVNEMCVILFCQHDECIM